MKDSVATRRYPGMRRQTVPRGRKNSGRDWSGL
jgi:hypothetical protein